MFQASEGVTCPYLAYIYTLITLTSITIVSHTYAEAPSDPRKRVEYEHVSAKVFAIDLKGFIAFMVLLGHFVPHHIITMLR